VIAVAICALPLLRPTGPGNTGPVDIALFLAIAVGFLAMAASRAPVRLPFSAPIGLFVIAGGIAVLSAGASRTSALTLVQDVFVLLWCGALATLGRNPSVLRTALHTWALSSTVYALVLLGAVMAHANGLAGITARNGTRAAFLLGDPNLAASYFVTSLLVLRAAQYPQRRILRWPCCLALIVAIVLTGSNGGVLALIVATLVGWILGIGRRRGPARAAIVAVVVALIAGAVTTTVHPTTLEAQATSSLSLVRDSVGRTLESTTSRTTIANESFTLWEQGPLLGIGPAMTKTTLSKQQLAYVKSAHDDYAAALIERGVLGGLAFLMLLWVIGLRTSRIVAHPLREEFATVVPRPELLAAAVVGLLLSGFIYQVLHFRHLWALLGIVAALDLWGRRS
jgi:O-antigen ligase